jgi:CubicO group peptidase (beta-lactamase class C family)
MSIDFILNIGSISKTITGTALLQLWEKNKFNLDEDICKYLPFKVRNPYYPTDVLTFRQLLTHTSSLNDGSNYKESYSCGDPEISLGEWLKEYFTPEGKYYVKEENFNNWKPGEKFEYSNVGFGLIGYLVEMISGKPFDDYCRLNIFDPLEMDKTYWFLSELDQANLAVPYARISREKNINKKLIGSSDKVGSKKNKDFIPLCLYSFPNYPDGLLRTSVRQLSRFLITLINNGLLIIKEY